MFKFKDYKSPIQEGIRLPKFKPSPADIQSAGLKEGADNYELLRHLCFQGIKKLGIDKLPNYDKYIDRAKHELKTLKDLCLVDYMLIVWDFINYANNKDIPIGNGRGSVGGSLVAYLIGLTRKVDPIKYNLYFERFISVDRVQPQEINGEIYLKDCADIDTDISYYRRHEILDYINTKYPGQTAHILTIATLSGKLCVKECVKIVSGENESQAQIVSNLVERTFGIVNSLKDVYNDTPSFKEWADENKITYKIARRIENLNKSFGVHASGLILSPNAREKLLPCQSNEEGLLITSWEKRAVEEISVKLDCLGLRTLDLLAVAEKESGVLMSDINPEDPSIYEQFKNLDHKYGLFQIETDGGYRITKQVMPSSLSNLSDIVAVNRPGTIIFLKDYLDYRNGKKEIPKLNPIIDEILSETGGVLLMQEQTMRILHEVYQFSLVEANQVRKIIGKKLKDKVGEWEDKIRNRGAELKIDNSITDWFWSSIKASADYQFNKSHSFSYAYITAYCAYYKANHPKQFFLGALKLSLSEIKPQDILSEICQELPRFGIKLLPPDLTVSGIDFQIEGKNIRYGLSAIKGIGAQTLENLQRFRDTNRPNKYSIFCASKNAGLSIGNLAALIQAGTLDNFGTPRTRLVLEAQVFNKLTDKEKNFFYEVGEKYNYDCIATIKACTDEGIKNEKGKPIISEKRLATLRKNCSNYFDIFKINSAKPKLASWWFEKLLLGYAYSIKLSECFDQTLLDYDDFKNMAKWEKGCFIGEVTEVTKSISKAGNCYIKLSLSSETGVVHAMLMDNKRKKSFTEYVESGKTLPEEKDLVIAYGSKGDDIVFCDSLKIVNEQIYTKFSQFTNEDLEKVQGSDIEI